MEEVEDELMAEFKRNGNKPLNMADVTRVSHRLGADSALSVSVLSSVMNQNEFKALHRLSRQQTFRRTSGNRQTMTSHASSSNVSYRPKVSGVDSVSSMVQGLGKG